MRGINDDYNVYEELADLCSLKETAQEDDLFISTDKLLNNFGFE